MPHPHRDHGRQSEEIRRRSNQEGRCRGAEDKRGPARQRTHGAGKSKRRDSGATADPENILRVDAERIDNVLNLVGELIIGKSMLQQVFSEFTRQFPRRPCAAVSSMPWPFRRGC